MAFDLVDGVVLREEWAESDRRRIAKSVKTTVRCEAVDRG